MEERREAMDVFLKGSDLGVGKLSQLWTGERSEYVMWEKEALV